MLIKHFKLIAILLILLVNTSTFLAADKFAAKITNSTDNSVTLQLTNDGSAIHLYIAEFNTELVQPNVSEKQLSNKIDASKIDFKKNQSLELGKFTDKSLSLTIQGLPSQTKFALFAYKKGDAKAELINKTPFFTLAPEPKKQVSALAFSNVTESSIKVLFAQGTGEGRIVVASKDKNITKPEDGKSYNANPKFGSADSKIGNGFIVANLKGKQSSIELKDLSFDTYYFQVFEYNGNGEFINYNLNDGSGNPRSKELKLKTPQVKAPSSITETGFVANWNKVQGATAYVIDIATDAKFSNIDGIYNNLDIGDIDSMEIVELKSGTEYYFRVKAIKPGNQSNYSEPQLIKLK